MNQRELPFHRPVAAAGRSIPVGDLIVFVGLVAAGAALRLVLRDLPNFAPVAAIALFAGFYLRSWGLAMATPVAIMVLSDAVIGGYDLFMMAVVYGFLVLPVLFRPAIRRHVRLEQGKPRRNAVASVALLTGALAGSVLFFLGTNFAVWVTLDMYETTWRGLVQCYVQAIPFFRYTLAGDALFALVLFGSHAAAVSFGWARERSPQGA